MKKTVRLTESQLINLVKKVVLESTQAEEPMLGNVVGTVEFIFKTGTAEPLTVNGQKWSPSDRKSLVKSVANFIKGYGTLDVLSRFYNNPEFSIPKFIEFSFGTSSTGSSSVNARVAEQRRKWLVQIVKDAFRELMPSGGPNDEQIEKLITNRSVTSYTPTSADANWVDRGVLKGDILEQFGKISVRKLVVKGMTPEKVRNLTSSISSPIPSYRVYKNKTLVDDFLDFFGQQMISYDTYYDSKKIYQLLNQIQTYSDIIDVNNLLTSMKNMTLEDFINETLNYNQIEALHNKFQDILEDSQIDLNTVQFRNGKIIIGLKGRERKYGN